MSVVREVLVGLDTDREGTFAGQGKFPVEDRLGRSVRKELTRSLISHCFCLNYGEGVLVELSRDR